MKTLIRMCFRGPSYDEYHLTIIHKEFYATRPSVIKSRRYFELFSRYLHKRKCKQGNNCL